MILYETFGNSTESRTTQATQVDDLEIPDDEFTSNINRITIEVYGDAPDIPFIKVIARSLDVAEETFDKTYKLRDALKDLYT